MLQQSREKVELNIVKKKKQQSYNRLSEYKLEKTNTVHFRLGSTVRFQKISLLTPAKQGRVNSEVFGVNSETFIKITLLTPAIQAGSTVR